MKKKKVIKPKPVGFAMLEKQGNSEYVCLYSDLEFANVSKSLHSHFQEYNDQSKYNDYNWEIVSYSNLSAWNDNFDYDSVVLQLNGKHIDSYEIAEAYLRAYKNKEKDSLLLKAVEEELDDIINKYETNNIAAIELKNILNSDSLKNMYRSVKSSDYDSYQEIYHNIDKKVKSYIN